MLCNPEVSTHGGPTVLDNKLQSRVIVYSTNSASIKLKTILLDSDRLTPIYR